MTLWSTTDLSSEIEVALDGCVGGLKRHHMETNRFPSQYCRAANMAWKENFDFDALLFAGAVCTGSSHSLDCARERFDMVSSASRLTSSTMLWADATSFTKPTPEPAYAVNLPFSPQP